MARTATQHSLGDRISAAVSGDCADPSPREWKGGVSSADASGLAEVWRAENWGQMKPNVRRQREQSFFNIATEGKMSSLCP